MSALVLALGVAIIGTGVAWLAADWNAPLLGHSPFSNSSDLPSIPAGAVGVVRDAPDGTITKAELDDALSQAAARQGTTKVPQPSDPQYAALRDAAMNDLILARWIRGEAEERGVTVSQSEVQDQLQQIIKQQFNGQSKFDAFLKQSHFSRQDALDRVELQLLSNDIQQQVLGQGTGTAEQQAAAAKFQSAFMSKWRARTACEAGFVVYQCANGPQPPPTTTPAGAAPPGVAPPATSTTSTATNPAGG
jgi:hypothetical protein